MSDQMQGGMAEAMRLMQKGDLTEATAVINVPSGVALWERIRPGGFAGYP